MGTTAFEKLMKTIKNITIFVEFQRVHGYSFIDIFRSIFLRSGQNIAFPDLTIRSANCGTSVPANT